MQKLNELVPVNPGNIGGVTVSMVSAKKLHDFLGVGRDFTTWIKGRISQYGFTAGVDFTVVENLSAPVSGSAKYRQQIAHDYLITIDMGKELAMVERNEKGREVRRYFINCERQAKAAANIPQTLPEALRLAADMAEKVGELESQLADAAPKVDFVDRYVVSTGSMGFREVAKLLDVKETVLRRFLVDKQIMYPLAGKLTPYASHKEAGRFTLKTGESLSSGHAFTQVKFTPKGVQWLAKLLVEGGVLGEMKDAGEV
ncbi:phage antirepressor KilAC domain-containing protein [Erwinia aphidicola]|uniref:phage antirepressor KilAC domain-containing protein n=1 Tax=Erwinia TaxID=551 RepID=UPI001FCE5EE0|nr:phage antirepressor KilAC domain-containing protein [Erwinia persicina]